MKFKDILNERDLNTSAFINNNSFKGKIVSIQVDDTDKTIKIMNQLEIPSRQNKKINDEVEIDISDNIDKKNLIKWMTTKGGWDKNDIEDLYPELLESETTNISDPNYKDDTYDLRMYVKARDEYKKKKASGTASDAELKQMREKLKRLRDLKNGRTVRRNF